MPNAYKPHITSKNDPSDLHMMLAPKSDYKRYVLPIVSSVPLTRYTGVIDLNGEINILY